jgi:hypothetical protein
VLHDDDAASDTMATVIHAVVFMSISSLVTRVYGLALEPSVREVESRAWNEAEPYFWRTVDSLSTSAFIAGR